jgi:hypothetical protein
MYPQPRSLGSRVFVAGLVAGLVAGCLGGCSKSGSTTIDLKRAREALAKRRSDYGETLPSQSRASDKAPVQLR